MITKIQEENPLKSSEEKMEYFGNAVFSWIETFRDYTIIKKRGNDYAIKEIETCFMGYIIDNGFVRV